MQMTTLDMHYLTWLKVIASEFRVSGSKHSSTKPQVQQVNVKGYNPELPVLEGPVPHIFIKHPPHAVKPLPCYWNPSSRELLLARTEKKML